MDEKREQLWEEISHVKKDHDYTDAPDFETTMNDLVGCWLWWHGDTSAACWVWMRGRTTTFDPVAFDISLSFALDEFKITDRFHIALLRIIRAAVRFDPDLFYLISRAQGLARKRKREDIAVRLNELNWYMTLCYQLDRGVDPQNIVFSTIRIMCRYILAD